MFSLLITTSPTRIEPHDARNATSTMNLAPEDAHDARSFPLALSLGHNSFNASLTLAVHLVVNADRRRFARKIELVNDGTSSTPTYVTKIITA